eukprot:4680300-Lingulodinium_polyedra.AAC.1
MYMNTIDRHQGQGYPEEPVRLCPGCLNVMPGMLCKCPRCNGHLMLYTGPNRRVERHETWDLAQAAW